MLAVSSFGFRVSGDRVSERRKEILCQIRGILGNLLTPKGFLFLASGSSILDGFQMDGTLEVEF